MAPATLAERRAPDGSSTVELRRDAARALIERYDKSLRRTARRFSLCADDAEDAYQRALEILLRKAPAIEPSRLVRWMHTVTRHEAYAVRRQRGRGREKTVAQSDEGLEVDAVELVASDAPGPSESAERLERLVRSREALKSLKPNEVRALTLKAEGYSYVEIAEMTGWSRTKINRLMVEGRRRFLDTFDDIEQGRRCEQLSGALSAFTDGELVDSERSMLMEHLGQCAHCKAKLREYRGVPQRVLELAPIGLLAGPSAWERIGDRFVAGADRARDVATSVIHRSGVADATQTVAAGGGSRGSGLALLATVCGLGAAGGGAAVCVDQGVVNNPFDGQTPPAEQTVPEPSAQETVATPQPPEPAADPLPPPPAEPPATPTEQRQREFSFESSGSGSGGTTEFGGSVGGGGGSSAGGGGSSGGGSGGFGFEK